MGRPRVTPNMLTLVREHGMVAFELAIMIAGNQTRLAERIGTNPQKVSNWKLRDQAVPVEWVPAVVAASAHPMITPYSLRPDMTKFWDVLAPQLAQCSTAAAWRSPLTRGDFNAAAKPYRTPAGEAPDTSTPASSRTRQQVSV